MPTDWQSLTIYAIVLLTLAWLIWRATKKRRCKRPSCPADCGCGDGLKRDPAIQEFLNRRKDGK